MGKKQKELQRIKQMREKIDRLTELGDTDGAELYKQKIHNIYKNRQLKKHVTLFLVLAVLAVIAIVALLEFFSFKRSLEARGDKIKQNLEGLVFSGEFTTDDGYSEGNIDPNKTYWQVYEHTTLTFNEKGNILQHSIHDKKLLAHPEGKKKPKDYYNESDSTIYSFEVFVNAKGGVFLHIKDSLFKVVLDEQDKPIKILDYHNKTLELEEK